MSDKPTVGRINFGPMPIDHELYVPHAGGFGEPDRQRDTLAEIKLKNAGIRIADLEKRLAAAEADAERLREYYQAKRAIEKVGLFFAGDRMLERARKAEQAIDTARREGE